MLVNDIVPTLAPESAGLHHRATTLATQRPYLQCRACLYDNRHPFGLTFDETGLCSGCTTHAEKTSLDWSARFSLLERLVQPYRQRKGNYDCVIPIRGTAEYFHVVDVVKNQLGLNPLLVAFNSQFNSTTGIQNLDQIRDTFDCDILLKTQSPLAYRKLMRETLSRFGSVHWPFLAGHTVWPVRVAVQHNIPLIVWPVHQPTEQAGMFSYQDENEMTRRSRHEHDLMRFEAQELVSGEALLREEDVLTSLYPSDRELAATGVRGIYLANYLPWDTRRYSEQAVAKFGAQAAGCPGTFDTYDHVDNLVYMSVHDAIKRRKLGYGRVRDHLCREIRFGRISRVDAVAIESTYAQAFSETGGPGHLKQMFFNWLGMNAQGFEWLMDYHFGLAAPRPPGEAAATSVGQAAFLASYQRTGPAIEMQDNYILIGKGLEV
ncbi:MAG: N-acetyl sugar amidotransferase [Bdellovibrionales bacterium]|nr:N-acetyl sugar amidotransferase [Ramlibacter sp.]